MRKARQRHFYPRPPRGGRRSSGESILPLEEISIHALREEGDLTTDTELRQTVISIHALREEGDRRSHRRGVVDQQISIHALREEGDGSFSQFILDLDTFLSTPSARRATRIAQRKDDLAGDFYPRPPRGGRPSRVATDYIEESISIHALREEGDSSVIRLPELS